MRVYQFAKRIGKTSKEIIELCNQRNITLKNHMSTLTAEAITKIERIVSDGDGSKKQRKGRGRRRRKPDKQVEKKSSNTKTTKKKKVAKKSSKKKRSTKKRGASDLRCLACWEFKLCLSTLNHKLHTFSKSLYFTTNLNEYIFEVDKL